MNALRRSGRDPFWDDGVGARRSRTRRRWVSRLALAIAIVASGLTAALWIRELVPLAEQLLG
jgi:cytoskeletal protein RodZ